jgi:hypothetical protein
MESIIDTLGDEDPYLSPPLELEESQIPAEITVYPLAQSTATEAVKKRKYLLDVLKFRL